ncbi:SDR family oxidoreductase [Noviherbaspirillum saxi]|uniref:SDR family oxidoreductase n=2 Tax=Noviherbaspirillum saxi TaxID=2320863 RepID=A0A3A3FN20_9BURK|nr:SDR family oxidoreductase [Noviherbaspirillum saxi]
MSFLDKVVLITGGARGIGHACASRFAQAGARVVIVDLLDEESARNGNDLSFACGYVQADAGNADAMRALVKTVLDSVGGIDICVCAAGIGGPPSAYWDLDDDDFDRVLAVNLRGPFVLGKLVGRHMRETRRKGSIIHVSSVGGKLAVDMQAAYCISKAGLDMLTKVMAVALAPHGIRVNAVGPGPVQTQLTAGLQSQPALLKQVLSRTPLGRFGTVEEIAGTVIFLAGPDAGFMTGQTVYADGGRLALNYMMPDQVS